MIFTFHLFGYGLGLPMSLHCVSRLVLWDQALSGWKKVHLGIFRSQIEPVMNHLHTRQSAKSTQNWVIFLPRDLLAKWRDLASSGWIKGHIHISNWIFIYNNMFLLTVIQGGIQGRIQGGIQGTSNKTGSDMTLGIYRSQIGPLLKIIWHPASK